MHATCVALAGKAVLITGPSGSGKSCLALELISLGAELVADDRTVLVAEDTVLMASPPPAIRGMIEARRVGLLSLPYLDNAPVRMVVDMAHAETARLPQHHTVTLLDIVLPCLHKVQAPYFPAAIHAYLRGTRNET